jgi:hypothetical protein
MFCYLQIKLGGCEWFYVTREIVTLQQKYNTFKSGRGEVEGNKGGFAVEFNNYICLDIVWNLVIGTWNLFIIVPE